MTTTTEAFARVKIDGLLKDAGWNLTDGVSVLFEHAHRSRPSTLDKKSFSIASRPILAWSFSTSFSLC